MSVIIRRDRKNNKCGKCGAEMREEFAAVYPTCDTCFSKAIDQIFKK